MIKKIFFVIFLLFFSFSSIFTFPSLAQENQQELPKDERIEAVITKILEQKEIETEGKKQLYQKLELKLTSGNNRDKTINLENGNIPLINVLTFRVGDKVIVSAGQDLQGNDVYYIADFVRSEPLYLLVIIFAVLTLLVARKRGLASLLGLVLSFLTIFYLVLPQILAGDDPVPTVVFAVMIIAPVNFYLSHGWSKKTTAALIGTFITLMLVMILSKIFIDAAKLSGFASEEAGFLQAQRPELTNIQGLIFAGIIVGLLGILDDITIAQAAVVSQLKAASPKISFKELFSRSMDIGRDHISSMVNTLIMVYAGASMPLLLLFVNNPQPFSNVINLEIIAEEIVRMLVGSIGLVIAVPITTYLTCLLVEKDVVYSK